MKRVESIESYRRWKIRDLDGSVENAKHQCKVFP